MAFSNSMSDLDYYPDHFIKYKFKEMKYLNCVIVAETWDIPAQRSMYSITSDFYHRAINLPYNIIHVDYIGISKVLTEPELFDYAHVVILPTEVSLFEDLTYWTPGPIYMITETIILSAVPKHTTLTSLSFLQMETQVMILAILALLLVSLTLTLTEFVRKFLKRQSKSMSSTRVLALNCLQHLWNSSSIFCSEPYPFISRILSVRIVTVCWLLGVTLFVSMVNCVMKSDFSEVRYQYLDDLETLMEDESVQPVVIENGFTHMFLQIASKRDTKIKEYLSSFNDDNFCSVIDLMALDYYEEILNGKKALIINRALLTWFLGYQLSDDLEETRRLKDKYDSFYISKRRVKSDFLALVYNRTFSKVSPIVYEQVYLANMVLFETAAFQPFTMKSDFALQFMEWIKPPEVTSSLSLSAMVGPFFIYTCGLILATAILIIEVTTFAITLISKIKPARRRKKLDVLKRRMTSYNHFIY